MAILPVLIQKTNIPQAQALWHTGQHETVFKAFFACVLIGCMEQAIMTWHTQFIKNTYADAQASATGGIAGQLLTYWQHPTHAQILSNLEQIGDKTVLQSALVLGLHSALGNEFKDPQTLRELIFCHLDELLAALPDWANLSDELIAQIKVERLLAKHATDETLGFEQVPTKTTPNFNHQSYNQKTHYNQDDDNDDDEYSSLPTGRPLSWLWLGLPLVAALGLGAYWYHTKSLTPAPSTDSATTSSAIAPTPLPPAKIVLSMDDKGNLYACHASLATEALAQQFTDILGKYLDGASCTIDVETGRSQSINFDSMMALIGLLKTSPYATLYWEGDQVLIDSPDSQTTQMLIGYVSKLLEVNATAVPELNPQERINQSITHATNALNALPSEADATQIAQALSAQYIDSPDATVPQINKAVLELAASYLKNTPNKLIIVAHSEDTGDRITAQQATHERALAVKDALVAAGVSQEQLVALGAGFDFPLANNQTPTGRFLNRRVEFLAYDEAILQALNQPQQAFEGGAFQESPAIGGAIEAPSLEPASTLPSETPPQVPTLSVVGNQIVEQKPSVSYPEVSYPEVSYPEQTISPSFASSRHSDGIPADLLTPIGSDPVKGQAAQYREP